MRDALSARRAVQPVGDLAFDLGPAFGFGLQHQDAVPQPDGFALTTDLPIGVAEVIVDLGVGRLLVDSLFQRVDGGFVLALFELRPAQRILDVAVSGSSAWARAIISAPS